MKRTFVVALLAIALTGCGRSYTLVGRVIVRSATVRVRAGIHEVTGRAVPEYGKGVAAATVTLFHEVADDGSPDRESTWQETVTSTADGTFELYSYATPGEKNLVGLEVSAVGYRTAYTTYWDYSDPDEQAFIVVLEPAG